MSKKQGEIIYSLDELEHVITQLLPLFEQAEIITLTGSLGAGKTTFVQELLKQLGVSGPVQSPTYAYVHTYKTEVYPNIFHFDLYRLTSLDDFVMAGFDEYLYQQNSKTIIEWPEIVMPLLQLNACHIELDYEGLNKRKLTYSCV